MNTYRIKIYNKSGVIIDNVLINAENENKALIYYLKENIIYSSDNITIEEE